MDAKLLGISINKTEVCYPDIPDLGMYYQCFSPTICLDCRRILNGFNKKDTKCEPIKAIVFTIAENHEQKIEL